MWANTTSSAYGHSEIKGSVNHFFANQKENIFYWKMRKFKFDSLSMRKRWDNLKENLSRNNLKQQYASTEWALKQTCATINCEEFPIISPFFHVA